MPTDALIVDALRSPIGRKGGTLSHIRGDDLSAQVVNALVERNGVDPAQIEDLQWGCVTQIEEQAWNIGRNVALTAGTGVFALLSTSKTMNVPDSAKTVIALGSLLFGQVTASLQPVLPADKVEKFDREVLEPSLVLDGGSCVERTVFASLDDGSTKTPALVFHVR